MGEKSMVDSLKEKLKAVEESLVRAEAVFHQLSGQKSLLLQLLSEQESKELPKVSVEEEKK